MTKKHKMYMVYGYTDMCEDFQWETDSFIEAIRFIKAHRAWCVLFQQGMSDAVFDKVYYGLERSIP